MHDELQHVALEGLRQPCAKRYANGDQQPDDRALDQRGLGQAVRIQNILVDDPAEDDRVEQTEDLRERGQEQGQQNLPGQRAEVAP